MFTTLFQTLHSLPQRAVQWLLKFLSCLLKVLGHFSPKIVSISQAFPGTIFLRSKYLKDVIIVPNVTRMVFCQSCHSLFSFNNCLVKTGSKLIIQSCSNCLEGGNTVQLLKRVVTIRGSEKCYPFKVYPVCSFTDYLKAILSRPGVIELCEKWRETFVCDPSHLRDIFDGKILSDFGIINGEPFLASSGSIGVILNIDWFQPFKHRQYSIGEIYL